MSIPSDPLNDLVREIVYMDGPIPPEICALTTQYLGKTWENIVELLEEAKNLNRISAEDLEKISNVIRKVFDEARFPISPTPSHVLYSLRELSKECQFEKLTDIRVDGDIEEFLKFWKKVKSGEEKSSIKSLDLSSCSTRLTNDLLEKVCKEFPNLTSLDLSRCYLITNEGLAHLSRLPNLTHLDLAGCNQITNEGLEYLSRLPSLTHLSLHPFTC